MWWWNHVFLSCSKLSKSTTIFGLKIWIVVCIGISVVLIFLFLSFFLAYLRRRRASYCNKFQTLESTTTGPKQIPEIISNQDNSVAANDIYIEIQKSEHRPGPTVSVSRDSLGSERRGGGLPEVSHLGWGHWYTLRELEEATGGLASENIVGQGGYGIVYHGVLGDHKDVAIKSLLNNRGQAEKEFRVEVDAIGRVRHKNLVRLLGYCAEGVYRILVYEYVDNGNLDKWLHGEFGEIKPLTWDTRMKIVLGTAKGLAYLHDGLEPKVVHRDIKASNILLDRHWHPKVSDFGLAKLLCSEKSYVTTRVMGTFGYVAPEYANTGMLNEKSDVYSFGVLIMEIISGRVPVDYTRPSGEVHLVEWLKTMVGERKFDLVVDPKIPEKPSSQALKRTLLVALRCTDPDAHNRPKMGQVLRMLETDDFSVHHNYKQGQ